MTGFVSEKYHCLQWGRVSLLRMFSLSPVNLEVGKVIRLAHPAPLRQELVSSHSVARAIVETLGQREQ